MDREQEEMQFLGFFGIYAESFKLIISCRKIFSKITLSLIIPMSFIYLVHMEVSGLLFGKIMKTEVELDETKSPAKSQKLRDLVSSEVAFFWLFKAAYFTLYLIFSLLSTAAVVYTVACIYTARELTFGKVMSVVPRVWKRLMVTFLCAFATMFVYNVVAVFVLVSCAIILIQTDAVDAVLAVVLVFYFVGFLYMTIIWQLASVVSVLEEAYGFQAMMKSRNLIKGKLWVAIVIFVKLIVGFAIIQAAFQTLVVDGSSSAMAKRVVYAILCFLLLSKMILFGLVIQTVIYFVCKSYHHENIDKSALSDHLEVYLGEYVPLKAKDVQLEQYQV
ncbi:hypothetical protein like AT4G19950 [Hibiscus trionum]|uniref:Uncharacterized protein n=1 Tax=Hibiscus trionum TaxID=183268 RepID=A0A9W7I546_HIBTR|nr:hypothetical protein like AT4G19950 [Hibiscus trionum]